MVFRGVSRLAKVIQDRSRSFKLIYYRLKLLEFAHKFFPCILDSNERPWTHTSAHNLISSSNDSSTLLKVARARAPNTFPLRIIRSNWFLPINLSHRKLDRYRKGERVTYGCNNTDSWFVANINAKRISTGSHYDWRHKSHH